MQANYAHDAELLIGCQVGGRSTQAAQLLTSHGYQREDHRLSKLDLA